MSGFGSLKQTLAWAKEFDPSIKLDDVRQSMEENTTRKQQLKGQNSFVANRPHHQYQLDLMYIKYLTYQKYDAAMVCVDVFTKYAAVVPVKGKTENDLAFGVIESIVKMGRKPKVIFMDCESGIRNSKLFQKYFTENKITVHYNRGHPVFAERFIGTFKIHVGKTNQARSAVD